MCHVVSVLHYVAINRPLGWSSCEAEPPWPSERSFGENVGATGSTVRGRPGATASPGTVTSRVGRSTCGSWRDGRGELIYLSLHLLGGGVASRRRLQERSHPDKRWPPATPKNEEPTWPPSTNTGRRRAVPFSTAPHRSFVRSAVFSRGDGLRGPHGGRLWMETTGDAYRLEDQSMGMPSSSPQ